MRCTVYPGGGCVQIICAGVRVRDEGGVEGGVEDGDEGGREGGGEGRGEGCVYVFVYVRVCRGWRWGAGGEVHFSFVHFEP